MKARAKDEYSTAKGKFYGLLRDEAFYRGLAQQERDMQAEQGLSDRRTASVTQREQTGQRYRLCVEYLEAQESYNEQLRKRDGRRPRVGEFGPSDERWPWYSELLGREMKISEVQKEMATHAESSGRAFPDTEDDIRQWLDTNEGRQAKDWSLWAAYDVALDSFEEHCISRQALRAKQNASGTGYNLRQKLRKASARHTKSRKAAYQRYKAAWEALPDDDFRPPLVSENPWTEGDNLSEEFSVARSGRAFANEAWADVQNKVGIQAIRMLDAAARELQMLRIEKRRLKAWLVEELEHYITVINRISLQSPIASFWTNSNLSNEELSNMIAICHLQERLAKLHRQVRLIKRSSDIRTRRISVMIEEDRLVLSAYTSHDL